MALNILSALIRVLAYVEKQHGGSKATKTLNLIKSIFWFCGEDTRCLLYETLVRPKLEHVSVVWDPHYLSGVYKLENIQRAAARFCTGTSHNQGITNILQV